MIKCLMKNIMFYALVVHLLLAGIGHDTNFALAAKGVTKGTKKRRAPRTQVNPSRNLGKGSTGSSRGWYYSTQNSSNQNNSRGYNTGNNYNNSFNNGTTSGSDDSFGFWKVLSLVVVGAAGIGLAFLAVPQIMGSYKQEKNLAQKAHTATTVKPIVQVVGKLPSSKYKAPQKSDFMTV